MKIRYRVTGCRRLRCSSPTARSRKCCCPASAKRTSPRFRASSRRARSGSSIWADFETADGIDGTPDGGVIFAQEQTDTIRKLDASGKEYTLIAQTRGAGSMSLDAQGRLYAVERTCTEPLNTYLRGLQRAAADRAVLARAAHASRRASRTARRSAGSTT